MADEIVGSNAVRSYGQESFTVEKRYRFSYEVWTNKTLVLRTVHQSQALRYARETDGEVRTVQQSGWE